MRIQIVDLAKAACWITVFSAVAFAIVKFAFVLVCWIAGHDSLEAIIGTIAPIVFGALIGIEAFLWFSDWRARSKSTVTPLGKMRRQ